MMPAPAARPPPSPPTAPAPARDLRVPFSIGDAIGRTFSVWWRNVLVFSLLTLAADLPVFLVSLLGGKPVPGMTAPAVNPFARAGAAPPAAPSAEIWLAYLATMLLFLVEAGAITRGVVDHLAGRRVSLGGMIATGLRRFLPMLAVGVLCYLLIVVGLVLLVVPGVFLACAVAVAVPASVAERPGVLGAIKRSFALTRGTRFSVLIVFLVVTAVSLAVNGVGSLLLPALTAGFSPMLGTLAGLAVNLVFGTLVWTAPGVVYHDLRAAKEGLDTVQLAAVFE